MDNALKFEAVLCAAAEILPYAKEDFIRASMSKLQHLSRSQRRKEEQAFREGFKNLHRILMKFSTIVERDNPEFFDRTVDAIVELVNRKEVTKW